jgi:hypothetical protein
MIIPIIVAREDLEAFDRMMSEALLEFPFLKWFIATLISGAVWYYFTPYGFSSPKVVLCFLAGGMTSCLLALLWMFFTDLYGIISGWIKSIVFHFPIYWSNWRNKNVKN